jgi:hypothetical protein
MKIMTVTPRIIGQAALVSCDNEDNDCYTKNYWAGSSFHVTMKIMTVTQRIIGQAALVSCDDEDNDCYTKNYRAGSSCFM